MTDEQRPPPAPVVPPKLSPDELKAINDFTIGFGSFADPENFKLPDETVQHWMGIKEDAQVSVSLTRKDLDHLFFFFAQITGAMATLQRTVQAITYDDNDAAQAFYRKSNEFNVLAENNFKRFFASVMKGAKTDV